MKEHFCECPCCGAVYKIIRRAGEYILQPSDYISDDSEVEKILKESNLEFGRKEE